MARVVLENVTKKFGGLVAVDDMSLEINDGEFMSLLGPSGCGKTTTLRLIAGLDSPTDGEIFIDDVCVNSLSPADRDIAMVFQFYAIYPGMTVYDNMAFPLKQQKLPKEDIIKKVEETADRLRIAHLLNEVATRLTVGERQRVALGRAMVRDPKVYLMDEPLHNLDAKLRLHMREELKRLQKDLGQTFIFVTHDQLEAIAMADRIAVMDKGVLQQYDTTENVYDHPRNLFVACFIGTPPMNTLNGTITEGSILDLEEIQMDISELAPDGTGSGAELVLGIRPSDITVHKEQVSEECYRTEVYMTESLGDRIIVDLLVGENMIRALTPSSMRFDRGETAWITLDKPQVHLFEKETGMVLS